VHFGCWTRFAADTFGKVSHFATSSGGRLAAFRGPFVCWPMLEISSKVSSASPRQRACGVPRHRAQAAAFGKAASPLILVLLQPARTRVGTVAHIIGGAAGSAVNQRSEKPPHDVQLPALGIAVPEIT